MLASLPFALADEEDPTAKFSVYHGKRSENKIAITVDDSYALDYTWMIRDLFHDLGVVGTFFPLGVMVHEEDGEEWQKIIDYGNEIGTHSYTHANLGKANAWAIITSLGRAQQALDAALGYHYQIQSFRPPYGATSDENGSSRVFHSAVTTYGYEHAIFWDVSQTNPDIAINQVQNGSILLYHARPKDYECLKQLIPALLEKGFELVTVSELVGMGPIETSDELYVYDKSLYQK